MWGCFTSENGEFGKYFKVIGVGGNARVCPHALRMAVQGE
jgi:hypothetical protein